MDEVAPKRRRRSRHRFSDIPDLTMVLHSKQMNAVRTKEQDTRFITTDAAESIERRREAHAEEFQGISQAPFSSGNQSGSDSLQAFHFDAERGDGEHLSVAQEGEDVLAMGDISEVLMDTGNDHEILDYEETLSSPVRPAISASLRISNWRVLWGLLRTNGAHKFTKTGYQSVRNLIEVISRSGAASWRTSSSEHPAQLDTQISFLPHFTTLHKHYRPILMRELLPRHSDRLINLDLSKAGARATTSASNGTLQSRVRIILPSEYARSDISTPVVWSQMKSTSLGEQNARESTSRQPSLLYEKCVDTWPVIAGRKWFYGPQTALHLNVEGEVQNSPHFAEAGDVVTVTLLRAPGNLPERFQRCFGTPDVSLEYETVRGTVICCWTVHHPSRKGQPSFSQDFEPEMSSRDRSFLNIFGFSSYVSPSDSVRVFVPDATVPLEEGFNTCSDGREYDFAQGTVSNSRLAPGNSEALRNRREALKRRKQEMESAWRNWQKPILKPGDFVTMICPCSLPSFKPTETQASGTLLTSVDARSRAFIVSRFWTENEERDMHFFWISGSESIDDDYSHISTEDGRFRARCTPLLDNCSETKHTDILGVQLTTPHPGLRGPVRYNPVSSVGTLLSGEDYFVYRFLLYWDGFEVQKGKSATGEGFYIICLNLPLAARGSPSAVRVLSLTPPGVSPGEVLSAIFADVLEGISTGFVDYDADGNRRQIFLDLVAFIGDTPAINIVLDVMGHTSAACCHLCRFVRGSKTLIGSRFAVDRSHGMLSHSMRSFFRHTAVRDSGAEKETCKQLGMKRDISPTAKVMLGLREKMFTVRNSIPKTTTGHSVVPYSMDPYRACLVAPDHLLTGHLRDCISLALRLLPSNYYRETCEKFMMAFLEDAYLPVQNRLVDHTKKSLFSMTMSEVYSLSVVADVAFLAGCKYASNTSQSLPLTSKCQEALRLVRSCTSLVSEFWYFPRFLKYGYPSGRAFCDRQDWNRTTHLQNITNTHLSYIAQICCMEDKDVLLLEDRRCPKKDKIELSKIMRDCMTAIRAVDKPNVHRLRELSQTTLPLFGFIGRVGELVLEKKHQALKRPIQQSKNHNIQLHAMSSAAFTDWQGRLTTSVSAALAGDRKAVRCCFRLLAGREAVSTVSAMLNPILSAKVKDALGPAGCIARELDSQGQQVLCPRAEANTTELRWTILRPLEVHPCGISQIPQHYFRSLQFLKRAHGGDLKQWRVRVGESASSKFSNGMCGESFSRGDILEILLCHPKTPSFHFPFLVQPTCISPVDGLFSISGTSFWCVECILSLETSQGPAKHFAAVLPCLSADSGDTESPLRFSKYKVDLYNKLSFARLDNSVRRAGVIHDCWNNSCSPVPNKVSLLHSPAFEPVQGAEFFALGKIDGYPPRMG